MNYPKNLNLKKNYPLDNKNTFKIAGRARYFGQPKNLKELVAMLRWAEDNKIPFFILGAGSNILVSDRIFKGLVIELSSPYFKEIKVNSTLLTVGAGVKIAQLLRFCQKHSLSGLEFLAGIPGTVGGSLAVNAGSWGKSILERLDKAVVLDKKGKLRYLKKDEINFSYRYSSLQNYIILQATFKMRKDDSLRISQRIEGYLLKKKATQDLTLPSAGCVFKNPAGLFAGRLIEECGLKGKRMGGAAVSEKHANFIVNLSGAKARDVIALIRLIQRRVKKKFGVRLEPEIRFLS